MPFVGNWQVNGILTLHTGNPYTLRWNGCQGVWNACRPDLVPGKDPQACTVRRPDSGPVVRHQRRNRGCPAHRRQSRHSNPTPPRRPERWISPSSRTSPSRSGAGSSSASRPPTSFNTPHGSARPDNNMQNANFGKITSTYAGSERHIQFALRFQF